MTPYDDDMDVSGYDLPDIATMAMARRTLRGLVADAPPTPSEQLAVVLREGLPVTGRGTGWGRITGRLASLGLAAKLMLAAGVAVASAGGAATAVAFSHESNHHGDHPDSPRNHPALVVPASAPGSQVDDRPEHGSHPGTVESHDTGRHGGAEDTTHDGDDGSGHHGSGSDDSTSGSHDGGSGSDDSTSGSHDGGSGSTSGGGGGGSSGTSGDSGGGSGSSSGSGSGTDSGSGSGSGTDGGSSGGTSDGGTSGH